MKRYFKVLTTVLLCLAMLCPVSADALTYQLSDTDISLQVDDTKWYIFTRDNIRDNPELEELGISYDTIHDILHNNSAYMDAIMFYEDGDYVELFVRKKAIDSGVANLSNYKDEEVLEFAEEVAKKQKAEDFSVYENDYKFARLEYLDSTLNYYICEYVTLVNKDNYTLTFQSTSPFVDSEYDEIKRIVDSIRFDVDPSLKEAKKPSVWSSVIPRALGGALAGGIAGGIVALINKKKSKKNTEAYSTDSAYSANDIE